MPAWLVTWVASVVTGLSERADVTVARAVITSPGRTGARKRQRHLQEDAAGPGQLLRDQRVEQP